MRSFAALYRALDATAATRRKLDAMRGWLASAAPADAAWAVYFLAGGKPRQTVPTRTLRAAALQATGVPEWLFDECYQTVGDLAETIALLLPPPQAQEDLGLAAWLHERILPLRQADEVQRSALLQQWWSRLDTDERFALNKLLTGSLRVGVSRALVTRALAEAFDLDPALAAQRMMGYTDKRATPDAATFERLVRPVADGTEHQTPLEEAGYPYPFFLAAALPPGTLPQGVPADWQIEWKWDGIRVQSIRRRGAHWLWSRGEELLDGRFPEIDALARGLPEGTVIDAELLCWDEASDRELPFAVLQRRINRIDPGPKLLREAPVALIAYDLLEEGGADLRGLPQHERRARLERLVAAVGQPRLKLSALVLATDWQDVAAAREQARAKGAEGLMIKRRAAPYGIGRTRSAPEGDWWKWKVDPLSVDAVLVYAQSGHGRRGGLYTDYTFALWDAGPLEAQRTLVPFAKAYSGLDDEEIRAVDRLIRKTVIEKFGPVRQVQPTMVFELGFEGIQVSKRHKSGFAVRFPRILRWRTDKRVEDADSLADLRALIEAR